MRPLQNRVLVRPSSPEDKTSGGIIIPDTSQHRPERGFVEAVSPEVEGDLKPGMEILHSRYGGTEIQIDGVDFILMTEHDVLGVLEDDE